MLTDEKFPTIRDIRLISHEKFKKIDGIEVEFIELKRIFNLVSRISFFLIRVLVECPFFFNSETTLLNRW